MAAVAQTSAFPFLNLGLLVSRDIFRCAMESVEKNTKTKVKRWEFFCKIIFFLTNVDFLMRSNVYLSKC